MPGIPTKFVVADLVLEHLRAAGSPQAELLENTDNLPFFYLGAIGADFGDLICARPELGASAPNTPYFQTWLPVLSILAGTPASGTSVATSGVYKNLKQLRDTVNKLNRIVKKAVDGNPIEKDIQKIALLNMAGELRDLTAVITDLQTSVGRLTTLRRNIGTSIFNGGPLAKTAPSKSWQVRDTLHGSRTGRFLQALHELAGDDQQRAYALGATIGYATDVCGNPFVNSVTGAPYRNHWWRHRWISNYIDTWVYGFYRQGGAQVVNVPDSGVPRPLYTNWPNLCEAGLHRQIGLPGLDADALLTALRDSLPVSSVVPQPFVDFWKQAYAVAYGAPDPSSGVDDAGLQSAFAMTWLILWIQTSGEVIPCIPSDQINYPDDCGARPPWVAVDGSITTGNGTVVRPPPASEDTDPSVAEVISGIALIILAASAYAAGMVIAAVEAVVAAAVLIADGETDPDWDALRCYVGWTIAYQNNLTNTLHDLLAWGGLGFPYTLALTHNDIELANTGLVVPPDAALNTARSKGRNLDEPASRWNASASPTSNWANPPTEPVETPREFAYPTPPTWPFHFVDGLQFTPPPAGSPQGTPPGVPRQVNPLNAPQFSRPLIRDADQFAIRQGMINVPGAVGTFFGNAVDVSLELILRANPSDFLNWDLDGDSGIGFTTWLLPTPTSPRSAAIPEPK